jgi:hypothetical protein
VDDNTSEGSQVPSMVAVLLPVRPSFPKCYLD